MRNRRVSQGVEISIEYESVAIGRKACDLPEACRTLVNIASSSFLYEALTLLQNP